VCTVVTYLAPHSDLPLLVAANRDEFLSRPTAGSQFLQDPYCLVAGVDLIAGGSWLGINEYGLVVAILNRRTGEARDPSKRSRGELCLGALRFPLLDQAKAWLHSLPPQQFNPCTLFLARASEGAWVTANLSDHWEEIRLTPGLHVLTNRPFQDVECQRRARAFRRFAALLPQVEQGWNDSLLSALRAALADHGEDTGSVADGGEENLCVHWNGYGTRSASVLAVFAERGQPHHALLWVTSGPPCSAEFSTPLRIELLRSSLDSRADPE
jgi:uncharacterized protein with NRDE domain